MSVTINARGTSVPYFGIGKGGITLYQGTTDPTATYTVRNGDYWLDSSINSLKVYSETLVTWTAPRLENLTFLDTTISSLGNDLILRPDDDRAVKVVTVDQDGNDVNGLITTENFRDLIIDPSIGGGGALKLGPLIWPLADGTIGQVLATTGTGTLLWADTVPSTINNLVDVIITDPVDGQYLKYDPVIPGWKNSFIDTEVFDYLATGLVAENGIEITPDTDTITFGLGDITPTSVSTPLLTMTGIGGRIKGNFDGLATDRTVFQSNLVNGNTSVAVMPSGTGTVASWQAYSTPDPGNTSLISIGLSHGAATYLDSGKNGSAPFLPFTIYTGGTPSLSIDVNGDVIVAKAGARIKGEFTTATYANRVAFQTSTPNSSTSVSVLPSGSGTVGSFLAANRSDLGNASVIYIAAQNTYTELQSTQTGTGLNLPLRVITGAATSLQVDPDGVITAPRSTFIVTGGNNNTIITARNIANGSTGGMSYFEALSGRGDSNTTFQGRYGAALRRTDGAAIVNGQSLGSLLFGGQFGIDTSYQSTKIRYPASITGAAGVGTFADANNMPTDIVFRTGTVGDAIDAANVTYGTERLRITSDGVASFTGPILFPTSSISGAGAILNAGVRSYSPSSYNYGIGVSQVIGGLEYHADQAGAGNHRWYSGAWNNPALKMQLDEVGSLTVVAGINPGNTARSSSIILDWYEEGTWTPTIVGTAVAGTGTYNIRVGRFQRVGNRVTVTARAQLASHTGTGSLSMSGLPYVSSAGNETSTSGFFNTLPVGSNRQYAIYIGPARATVEFYSCDLVGGAAQNIAMATNCDLIFTTSYEV